MVVRALAIVAVAGCSFNPGRLAAGDDMRDDADVTEDDALVDATPDAPFDAPAACAQWTPAPKHFDPCAIVAPGAGLTLTGALNPWVLDTTAGTLAHSSGTVAIVTQTLGQTGADPALLVSVQSLTIEAGVTLTVTGTKPLIVASWTTISVSGSIDVTSHLARSPGAGSNPAVCAMNPPTSGQGALGTDDASGGGSGGGGGGGFRGAGGTGGPGDSGAQNAGGIGGNAVVFPTVVRGGCAGGASGMAGSDGADPTRRAPGGAGGGAIQLTAKETITVIGAIINAGGSGGAGTLLGDANGGGGGGSGGYIGFNAPIVTLTSVIFAANGGGGGGSAPFASAGGPGQDGVAGAAAASGGPASSCSFAGGTGSVDATLTGATASQSSANCGGGGGGGGAGYIGVFSPGFMETSTIISPPHQLNPF